MVDVSAERVSFPLAQHPRLRPIEVFPIQERGRRSFVLRDPADPKISPIVVSDGAGEVLALLDGRRTLPELAAALLLRGATIAETQLRSFLTRLDEAGFLDGPQADHRLAARKAAFLGQPVRPAIHAGGAYPDGVEELPRALEAGYFHADGPGNLPGNRGAVHLRAAI